MYRTNGKEVKKAVREYLISEVMTELEEREIITDKPFNAYMDIIRKEKFYQNYTSDYEMFKDWLQGLGGFGADIYYHGSKKGFPGGLCQDILQVWLNQTDAEVRKYNTNDSENLMLYLCYREFDYMRRKEDKK